MYLFTYGILTNNDCMPSNENTVRLGPAVLHGHKFVIGKYANIIEQKHSSVRGILWEIDDEVLLTGMIV